MVLMLLPVLKKKSVNESTRDGFGQDLGDEYGIESMWLLVRHLHLFCRC